VAPIFLWKRKRRQSIDAMKFMQIGTEYNKDRYSFKRHPSYLIMRKIHMEMGSPIEAGRTIGTRGWNIAADKRDDGDFYP
jgi:hypothetical protein